MNEAAPLQAGSSIDRLYRNDATAKVRLAVRKLASLGDNESGAASVRARFTNRCGQGLCRLEVALPVRLESALGGTCKASCFASRHLACNAGLLRRNLAGRGLRTHLARGGHPVCGIWRTRRHLHLRGACAFQAAPAAPQLAEWLEVQRGHQAVGNGKGRCHP